MNAGHVVDGSSNGSVTSHEDVALAALIATAQSDVAAYVSQRRVPLLCGSVVLCSKRGGAIEPCTTGAGKANLCDHSKWERLATFDGPCSCSACHDWLA